MSDLREALKDAQQFIRNGIDLGFIQMPDDQDDPAHATLPKIEAALAQPEEVEPVVERLATFLDAQYEGGWGGGMPSNRALAKRLAKEFFTTPPLAPDERMRRALDEETLANISNIKRIMDSCEGDFSRCVQCDYQDDNATRHSNLYLLLKDEVEALSRADEGKESEGGLNRQARNPVGLPDGSGDLASAGGIARDDIIDHHRQVGGDSPSDPTPQDATAQREAIARINERLADLVGANEVHAKRMLLSDENAIARNNREASWLKDLRSILALKPRAGG